MITRIFVFFSYDRKHCLRRVCRLTDFSIAWVNARLPSVNVIILVIQHSTKTRNPCILVTPLEIVFCTMVRAMCSARSAVFRSSVRRGARRVLMVCGRLRDIHWRIVSSSINNYKMNRRSLCLFVWSHNKTTLFATGSFPGPGDPSVVENNCFVLPPVLEKLPFFRPVFSSLCSSVERVRDLPGYENTCTIRGNSMKHRKGVGIKI